jgi:hypothetical protein
MPRISAGCQRATIAAGSDYGGPQIDAVASDKARSDRGGFRSGGLFQWQRHLQARSHTHVHAIMSESRLCAARTEPIRAKAISSTGSTRDGRGVARARGLRPRPSTFEKSAAHGDIFGRAVRTPRAGAKALHNIRFRRFRPSGCRCPLRQLWVMRWNQRHPSTRLPPAFSPHLDAWL